MAQLRLAVGELWPVTPPTIVKAEEGEEEEVSPCSIVAFVRFLSWNRALQPPEHDEIQEDLQTPTHSQTVDADEVKLLTIKSVVLSSLERALKGQE